MTQTYFSLLFFTFPQAPHTRFFFFFERSFFFIFIIYLLVITKVAKKNAGANEVFSVKAPSQGKIKGTLMSEV
jgi:hypothetical protein